MIEATQVAIETAESAVIPTAEQQLDERRRHPRYPFSATVEALESKSRARVQGRTADMGQGGCYVDTISPFPVETVIKLRLINENQSCETQAKVVYSLPGMGMGVSFIPGPQGQPAIIAKWIGQLSGEIQPEVEELSAVEERPTERSSSIDEPSYVMAELIIELMREGVLSDSRGKAMVQRLLH